MAPITWTQQGRSKHNLVASDGSAKIDSVTRRLLSDGCRVTVRTYFVYGPVEAYSGQSLSADAYTDSNGTLHGRRLVGQVNDDLEQAKALAEQDGNTR